MDWLMQIELGVTHFLQNMGSWLEYPMQAFSFLGNELFFLLIMPAIFWSIDAATGFRTAMMLILSAGLNSSFKMMLHSPRPFWVDAQVQALSSETSFGLPSGHSQNSAAIWGIIAASAKKKWLTILCILIIFFVGISRIYLGMHFVRDVLGGWLLGGLLVWGYLKLEAPLAAWLKRQGLGTQLLLSLLLGAVIIGLGVLVKSLATGFSLPEQWITLAVAAGAQAPDPYSLEGVLTLGGVGFGFCAGFALYRHFFGQYVIHCNSVKRFLRYLLGLIGIVAFYFGLKLIFPTEPPLVDAIFRVLRYTLIGLWVSFIAPWLFRVLKLDC